MSSTAASSTTASSGASTNTVTERGKAYVTVLSCVLSRLVASNDAMPDTGPVTKFHALRPPSISIHDYCMRIYKYASCSPECFVLALVFIDRLIQRNALLLTSLNVHRVIITAVMLAAKFFDDQYFNNAYYAKVGGVPTTEVNSLELEFLFSINFSLHVPTDVYEKYYGELGNHMGVGVPPELMPSVTGASGNGGQPSCNCSKFAQAIAYTSDELRYTGMRSLDVMAAESLAAFKAAGSGSSAAAPTAPVPPLAGGPIEGMAAGGMAVDDSRGGTIATTGPVGASSSGMDVE